MGRVPGIPGKKETLLQFLQRGVAMVHLDARRPGVIVPPQYASEAHLRLNLSYRYKIPDFEIDERRVQATLSFGGRPFRCHLPWDSIFGITSHGGDGQVWPEDLPREVIKTLGTSREGAPEPARRPTLTPVARDPEDVDPVPASRPSAAPTGQERPRPHLRLVR
jgi:stringent starvation protein B